MTNKTTDFAIAEQVVYVSNRHLEMVGGAKREDGVVTSLNNNYVFVRFGNDVTGRACRPEDFEHRGVR